MSAEIQIDLPHPARLSRAHLLVRLLIGAATGGLFHAIGWPGGVVYLGLPALAAILIAQHGPERYLAADAPHILRVMGWLLAFYAYMTLLTDEFPLDAPRVRYDFAPNGSPKVGSAVLRILMSLPVAFVLMLLTIVAGLIAFCAMIAVLLVAHYPPSWFDFQSGVLRIHGRFLAYHASLTGEYPSFSFHGTPSLPAARAGALPRHT
jgi:hypothetical protein